MRLRLLAYATTLLLAGFVASPIAGAFPDDDFPVSTYPMFAGRRSTVVSVPSVQVLTPAGTSEPARPSLVANDEVIQAFETVRQAIRQGPVATDALCLHVAGGLTADEATEVRVQTAEYDALAYFEGEREPVRVRTHATCEVVR